MCNSLPERLASAVKKKDKMKAALRIYFNADSFSVY
jgi:hypothetical protein